MLNRNRAPHISRQAGRALAGGALVAAVTAAVAVGQSGERDGMPSPSSNRSVASGVQADQARNFAIFGRARTSADAMPAAAREQVGNSRHSGRNVDLSRAIATTTGRGWAVPGNGSVCLVVPDPVDGYGITCPNTERAATHGLIAILVSPSEPEVANVTMLSPRGSRIFATLENGQRRDLRADADGVISERLEGGVKISVQTRSGTNTLDLPDLSMPTGGGVADCGDGVYVDEKAPCP